MAHENLMVLVQSTHDEATDAAYELIQAFAAQMLTLQEFVDLMQKFPPVVSIPGVVDKNTGLRHETDAERLERMRKDIRNA